MSATEADADLLSPRAIADPYGFFGELRERDPVHWNERYRSWVLTRYDDVAAASRDPRLSADRISGALQRREEAGDDATAEVLRVLAGWMVFRDPPDHTRLRRLVNYAFTPRRVTRPVASAGPSLMSMTAVLSLPRLPT